MKPFEVEIPTVSYPVHLLDVLPIEGVGHLLFRANPKISLKEKSTATSGCGHFQNAHLVRVG
jgi:hypothetical protein